MSKSTDKRVAAQKAALAEKEPSNFHRMSEDEIRQFVLDYCNGAVFTSIQTPGNLLGTVFLVLGLGGLPGFSKSEIEQIGLVWEHMSKSIRMAVNGMPMFVSCNIMHRDDWERARAAISREFERREKIEV